MEDNFPEEVSLESNEMPDFKAFQSPIQIPVKEINSFFDLFIPSKGYFVAPILININILIFILMLIGAGIIFPGFQVIIRDNIIFDVLYQLESLIYISMLLVTNNSSKYGNKAG